MTAAVVFNGMIYSFGIIAFISVAYGLILLARRKVKEIMNRQNKIRLLCKHEYVKKVTWKHFEHDFSKNNIYDEVELQCRKCGKKKTICIYENEVM